jgi:hypothetical protein
MRDYVYGMHGHFVDYVCSPFNDLGPYHCTRSIKSYTILEAFAKSVGITSSGFLLLRIWFFIIKIITSRKSKIPVRKLRVDAESSFAEDSEAHILKPAPIPLHVMGDNKAKSEATPPTLVLGAFLNSELVSETASESICSFITAFMIYMCAMGVFLATYLTITNITHINSFISLTDESNTNTNTECSELLGILYTCEQSTTNSVISRLIDSFANMSLIYTILVSFASFFLHYYILK